MSDERQFEILRYLAFHRAAYGAPADAESVAGCVGMATDDAVDLLRHMEESGAVVWRELEFAGSGWDAAEPVP